MNETFQERLIFPKLCNDVTGCNIEFSNFLKKNLLDPFHSLMGKKILNKRYKHPRKAEPKKNQERFSKDRRMEVLCKKNYKFEYFQKIK